MGIITTNCHIKLFKPGTAGVRIPLGAPLFSPFLFRDFQGHPYCSFELVRLPVLPAASPEFQLVVGQFEIAEIVLAQMKTLVESLSIGSGAILIAVLSVGVVWLLCSVLPVALRWLWVVIVPFILSYSLYWLPVWLGADPSEFSAWEIVVIAPWFLSGAIPCAVLVLILRK